MSRQRSNLTRLLSKLLFPSSLILSTALSFAICFAMPQMTERFYVNDAANILSAETEDFIFENSKNLDTATGAQIVVVTVPDLEGRDLESYATELFRTYGIGDKEKNNGLLLLLTLKERQSRVEVGYGLEGALPDGKTGRIQDRYMIPYFRENMWDEGIASGYKAFFADSTSIPSLALSKIPFHLWLNKNHFYETETIFDWRTGHQGRSVITESKSVFPKPPAPSGRKE